MKELHGQASSVVAAPVARCVEVLVAVDRYPQWYPEVVRDAHTLATDDQGQPARADASLHVARGPLVKDFRLDLNVAVDSSGVIRLSRIPHGPSDKESFEVTWRVEPLEGGTRVTLALDANLSVPRLVPVGGVGDALAEGFVTAAVREIGS